MNAVVVKWSGKCENLTCVKQIFPNKSCGVLVGSVFTTASHFGMGKSRSLPKNSISTSSDKTFWRVSISNGFILDSLLTDIVSFDSAKIILKIFLVLLFSNKKQIISNEEYPVHKVLPNSLVSASS